MFKISTVPKLAICQYRYWVMHVPVLTLSCTLEALYHVIMDSALCPFWYSWCHFWYWALPVPVWSYIGSCTGTALWAHGAISGNELCQFRNGHSQGPHTGTALWHTVPFYGIELWQLRYGHLYLGSQYRICTLSTRCHFQCHTDFLQRRSRCLTFWRRQSHQTWLNSAQAGNRKVHSLLEWGICSTRTESLVFAIKCHRSLDFSKHQLIWLKLML